MKQFFFEIREYGLHVALSNVLITFTKWFIGARRITIVYKKK